MHTSARLLSLPVHDCHSEHAEHGDDKVGCAPPEARAEHARQHLHHISGGSGHTSTLPPRACTPRLYTLQAVHYCGRVRTTHLADQCTTAGGSTDES